MKRVIFGSLFLFLSVYPQSVNLRDTTNQFDYIIITTPEIAPACQSFVQHKEIVRDLKTILVDTAQIFAEFNSSSSPEQKIREFISYAGTYWRQPFPKFVLIMGTNKMVPGFLTSGIHPYYSDFYYGQSIYENDSTTTEFYVGRLPVKNIAETGNILSKIIEYELSQYQDWMNNILVWHDDNPYFNFPFYAIFDRLPGYIRKFRFISEPDSSAYGNKDSIFNFTEQTGTSVIFFSSAFINDSFYIAPYYFNIEDVSGFNNAQKYFFSMHFHQRNIVDTNTSFNREMLVLSYSGSLGSIGFQGLNLWGIVTYIWSFWLDRLFIPEYKTLGEIFNLDPVSISFYMEMIKSVSLWADPSLILQYDVTTGIGNHNDYLPEQNLLYQNYPNPFNPVTTIQYSLLRVSFVTIKVFDILGNEIEALVKEEKPAGNYKVLWNAGSLPSGVYFLRMQAGGFVQTRKMILMK